MNALEFLPFELGDVVCTIGIHERVERDRVFHEFILSAFKLYMQCKWGDMDEEDIALNDESVKEGDGRIMGVYVFEPTGEKIWIITESDRSVTTILFPSEY